MSFYTQIKSRFPAVHAARLFQGRPIETHTSGSIQTKDPFRVNFAKDVLNWRVKEKFMRFGTKKISRKTGRFLAVNAERHFLRLPIETRTSGSTSKKSPFSVNFAVRASSFYAFRKGMSGSTPMKDPSHVEFAINVSRRTVIGEAMSFCTQKKSRFPAGNAQRLSQQLSNETAMSRPT